jgi:hypothetical protein
VPYLLSLILQRIGLTRVLGDLGGAAQDALAYAHGGKVHDHTDVRRKAGSPRVVGVTAVH